VSAIQKAAEVQTNQEVPITLAALPGPEAWFE
jgi:hypothetical protein